MTTTEVPEFHRRRYPQPGKPSSSPQGLVAALDAIRSAYQPVVDQLADQVCAGECSIPPKPAPTGAITTALAMADGDTQIMILLGALAGLRRTEIANLERADLYPEAEPPVIHVPMWSLRSPRA